MTQTNAPRLCLACAVVCISLALFLACQSREAMPEPTIEEAQQALSDSVMGLPGVTGIALGECEGNPCITVMVVRQSEELSTQIPETFQGFPVVVAETGEIRAHNEGAP